MGLTPQCGPHRRPWLDCAELCEIVKISFPTFAECFEDSLPLHTLSSHTRHQLEERLDNNGLQCEMPHCRVFASRCIQQHSFLLNRFLPRHQTQSPQALCLVLRSGHATLPTPSTCYQFHLQSASVIATCDAEGVDSMSSGSLTSDLGDMLASWASHTPAADTFVRIVKYAQKERAFWLL